MTGAVGVRLARAADGREILQIERAADFAAHWPEDVYRRALAGESSRGVLVAVEEERLLGFCVVSAVVEAECELENMAVRAEVRRRGTGQALLGSALQWAMANGARAMHLEVRASNAAAIALYRSVGFAVAGERRGYYADTGENALLFRRELKS